MVGFNEVVGGSSSASRIRMLMLAAVANAAVKNLLQATRPTAKHGARGEALTLGMSIKLKCGNCETLVEMLMVMVLVTADADVDGDGAG